MQQIRRAVINIKTLFFSIFSRPDPISKIKEEFRDINQMAQDFEEINQKLDQLTITSEKQEIHNLEAPTQSSESDYYEGIIERTYSLLTKKQREFYILISEPQYRKVLEAFKEGKYSRLKQGTWLNDEIINDFLKTLPLNQDTVILNSFQFELLSKADTTKFNRIIQRAKVTDKTNYIIAPFNSNNTHWFTFHIDFKNMQITIFDSMARQNYGLFSQLIAIAKTIKNGEYETFVGSCPQQTNMYDCGVFTIKNIWILSKYPNAKLNNYYDQSTIFYDRIQICWKLIQ